LSWNLAYSGSRSSETRLDPILINVNFTADRLIIKVESDEAEPYWWKAGWIVQRFQIEGFSSCTGPSNLVGLATQLIFLPQEFVPYQLQFDPVNYLKQVSLSVWEPV
jgi:hypothetical protein